MRKRGMPTDPIQRASAVASDYEALQGLITLGAGVGLIVMALASTPLYGAVLVAAAVPIGQGYYFKKYGRVRQNSGQTWAAVGSAVVAAVVACVGIMADASLQLPVMLGPLTGAVALLVFGGLNYRHVGVTRIQLAAVAVLAVGALIPLTGLVDPDVFWRVDVWLIGLALIVFGAVDHHRLTNAMRPVADG